MYDLTDRQKRILEIIVTTHVKNGRPVGSETIAARYPEDLSPATIRNVMRDLEEMSYIVQPYPSAGRLPTDRGYRYYVDHLMSEKGVAPHVAALVAREYRERGENIESLVERTSRILSDLSVQAGFVMFPQFEALVLNRIELALLDKLHLMVVWMAGNGFVQNHVIQIKEVIPEEELNQVSRFLNQELRGIFLDEVRSYLDKKAETAPNSLRSFYQSARTIVLESFPKSEGRRISLEGSSHILRQPEFQNRTKSRQLFKVFEERSQISELLQSNWDREGVQVHIGVEHHFNDISDCSFVTARYQVHQRTVGGLGVMGPKRMPYPQIISLVDFVSRRLSEALERW